MPARTRRWLAALACVWIGGCGEPAEQPADAASSCDPATCGRYACDPRTGACFIECRIDEQCAPDHICDGGRCLGTECTPASASTVCGPYACVDGVCATDCAQGPCADGFYCHAPDLRCMPRCTRRSDPSCDGFVCEVDVGECEPYCLDGELPCAAGHVCASGICEPDLGAPACSAGCGLYQCVTLLDRCASHCNDDLDCVAAATCVGGRCTAR